MQWKLVICAGVLCLASVSTSLADSNENATDDAQQVARASAQFYQGLNLLFTGDAEPMTEVWSHADDTTYMGPAGGIKTGWPEIRAEWEAQAALNLGGKIVAEDERVVIGYDLAIVQCREVGSNFNAEGERELVSIRATNIFRKENGAWKMIGHHTDLLPFLDKTSVTVPTSILAE